MCIWSGIGVNYGWQPTYDTNQTEDDFTFLKSQGVTRLRICLPSFSFSVARWQDMVVRALAHGFYVAWGVSISDRPITSTVWESWKAYIFNTLVPWAQSVGLSELILGNEFELHIDNTTLTSATVRSDLRSMATSIKAGGFSGKISYNTNIGSAYGTPWVSEGLGDLDLLGCNSYDTFQNFDSRNSIIISDFGNKVYISEFGSKGGGYPDFNDEQAFYDDTLSRIQSMQNAGIQSGYFFCYRDGGFGVPANTFGLIETNGTVHLARNAVLGY